MWNLECLRRRLDGCNAIAIGRIAGVHPETVRRIRRGEAKNPSYETIQKIEAALASLSVQNRESGEWRT